MKCEGIYTILTRWRFFTTYVFQARVSSYTVHNVCINCNVLYCIVDPSTISYIVNTQYIFQESYIVLLLISVSSKRQFVFCIVFYINYSIQKFCLIINLDRSIVFTLYERTIKRKINLKTLIKLYQIMNTNYLKYNNFKTSW